MQKQTLIAIWVEKRRRKLWFFTCLKLLWMSTGAVDSASNQTFPRIICLRFQNNNSFVWVEAYIGRREPRQESLDNISISIATIGLHVLFKLDSIRLDSWLVYSISIFIAHCSSRINCETCNFIITIIFFLLLFVSYGGQCVAAFIFSFHRNSGISNSCLNSCILEIFIMYRSTYLLTPSIAMEYISVQRI